MTQSFLKQETESFCFFVYGLNVSVSPNTWCSTYRSATWHVRRKWIYTVPVMIRGLLSLPSWGHILYFLLQTDCYVRCRKNVHRPEKCRMLSCWTSRDCLKIHRRPECIYFTLSTLWRAGFLKVLNAMSFIVPMWNPDTHHHFTKHKLGWTAVHQGTSGHKPCSTFITSVQFIQHLRAYLRTFFGEYVRPHNLS